MKARSPTVALWLITPLLFFYGVLSWLWPQGMSQHFQIDLPTKSGRAEFLSMYAGVPIGVALFLAWCNAKNWFRPGLLCAGLVLTGFAAFRVYGMVTMAGSLTVFSKGALAIEAVGAALAWWSLAGVKPGTHTTS